MDVCVDADQPDSQQGPDEGKLHTSLLFSSPFYWEVGLTTASMELDRAGSAGKAPDRSSLRASRGRGVPYGSLDNEPPPPGEAAAITPKRSYVVVAVLCYVNLLNYMDRYTIAGEPRADMPAGLWVAPPLLPSHQAGFPFYHFKASLAASRHISTLTTALLDFCRQVRPGLERALILCAWIRVRVPGLTH